MSEPSPKAIRPMRRRGMVLLAYIVLIGVGVMIGRFAPDAMRFEADRLGGMPMLGMLLVIFGLYILMSAVPFIPGAEIGLALIAAFGTRFALWVYLSMVCALLIAYCVGRLVPPQWLAAQFRRWQLPRAAGLVEDIARLSPEECVGYFKQQTNNRWLHRLLGYRYIALAVVLNLPGNTLIGGGGGIALFAGMSRLFSPVAFLLAVLIAVAPIPIAVYVMGYSPVQ